MLGALADLILPRRCAGCGDAGGHALCASCAPPQAPLLIGAPGLRIAAAGTYDGGLRRAVLGYKERGRRELARPLAGLLAIAAATVAAPGSMLVPVPSMRAAARRRGGDHVARLARHVARPLGGQVSAVLTLARPVRDSAGLGISARRLNLGNAMRARAPAAGGQAILLDDIVTTGATLVEAARALRAAGWQVAGAAVIAATPRREHPRARSR